MHDPQEVRRVRRWRAISENRQIFELTPDIGISVAQVARANVRDLLYALA